MIAESYEDLMEHYKHEIIINDDGELECLTCLEIILDETMTTNDMIPHIGHDVKLVNVEDSYVALQCDDCCETLADFNLE